jgi:carbonic anhydrase/acetyltransferase-like protein (isoleucine patch superfamily)
MEKRHVVIIGNAGAARECHWLLGEVVPHEPDLTFKGFLSFEGYAGDLRGLSHLQLGNDDDYTAAPGDIFVIGIGLPSLRAKAWAKWKTRGATFINLIHPACFITKDIGLGEGNIITPACSFSCNVTVGNANYFNGGVVVGHDAHIGDANYFGTYSMIAGNAVVGSRNSFGVGSVALERAKIGNDNTIAPGAYVYKGCRNGRLMAGNPAFDISGS